MEKVLARTLKSSFIWTAVAVAALIAIVSLSLIHRSDGDAPVAANAAADAQGQSR